MAAEATDRATTVLVVDDHQMLAESLAVALDLQTGMRCVGTAGTVPDALVAVARWEPDVVLMDLGLPGIDGIEGTRLVRAQHPCCRVLAFTGNATVEALLDVAEAGACGFLPKHVPLGHLAEAIRDHVTAPTARTSPAHVLHEVLGRSGRTTPSPRTTASQLGLTEREHVVLVELAHGFDVKQIARQLGITVNTCRDYVRAVRHKLGVHTQLAAVVRAAHEGLLPNLRGGAPADPADQREWPA